VQLQTGKKEKMTNRKKIRTLNLLCRKYFIHPLVYRDGQDFTFSLDKQIAKYKGIKGCENLVTIAILFKELGYSDKRALFYWHSCYENRKARREVYLQKPIIVRKDNKDVINYGSGGCNRSKIRYPKKVRKTAWKRFYKLFPNLKPE